MAEKQALLAHPQPSNPQASNASPARSYNTGNTLSPGGHLGGNPQPCGPQPGYPAGYFHPTGPGNPPQQLFPSSQHAYQQTVVVNQPTNQVFVHTPKDNLGLAIFAAICCFLPLGIMAIIRSSESRRALDRGDILAASRLSTESRRFSLWAISVGCFISFVCLIVIIMMLLV